MGKLIGDADQISGYSFSSTYLGNKATIVLTTTLKPMKINNILFSNLLAATSYDNKQLV